MKIKLFFSLIAFFMLSLSASYASFPVEQKTTSNTTTTVEVKKDDFSSPASAKGEKSQIIAAILAFAIGAFGIHRFYLGYTWQGIVQLLTLGGCGIWSLIDLIRICTGDLQPKDGKYDKTF